VGFVRVTIWRTAGRLPDEDACVPLSSVRSA
jgi:hypothetical protein